MCLLVGAPTRFAGVAPRWRIRYGWRQLRVCPVHSRVHPNPQITTAHGSLTHTRSPSLSPT